MLALALAGAAPVRGHELPDGVGTQTSFFFHEKHLEIELNFGISTVESWGYLARMDQDRDHAISPEECFAFMDEWSPKLIAAMDLRVNGVRPTQFEVLERWDAGIRGRILNKSLDAFYKIRCPLPAELPSGGWWLHYVDRTFEKETSTQFTWIRMDGQGPNASFWIFDPPPFVEWGGDYQMAGRKLTVFFDDEFRSDIDPRTTLVPKPSDLIAPAAPTAEPPANPDPAATDPSGTTPSDVPPLQSEPGSASPTSTSPSPAAPAARPWLLIGSGAVVVVSAALLAVLWWRRRSD